MSTFAFRAVDLAGVPSRGEVEAASKVQVSEQLRQRGLIVLDVTQKREALRLDDIFKRFRRVKLRNLSVFSRQFATLIDSGMPMLRSLHTLEDQTEDELLKETIVGIRQDIEAGSSVASALDRHPQVFDPLYRSMVRSGEGSGRLEEVLDRVAYQLEKLDALKRQIRSAMAYPIVVFALAIAVMLAVVTFIVPVFTGIYDEIASETGGDAELPFMTQITVAMSGAVTGYWYVLIIVIPLLVLAALRYKRTERGRDLWDRAKLRLPARVGDVVQKVALARWSRTFSGTVAAGVPILQSIRVTGQTSGNTVIAKAMEEVYESVKRGGTIAKPISGHAIFPSMVSHMVAVGEETGQLEHMLAKIADFYEAEVDAKIKALTSLIEPLMIMFVGGVVGFIVISMYLPIFDLYDKIR
ncbi:MAG TPA: type II secretion system F family protein [Solirubrobacterales bacterium]|nr:type II secretion system F family protein [Solirubrobacterales bacterium]